MSPPTSTTNITSSHDNNIEVVDLDDEDEDSNIISVSNRVKVSIDVIQKNTHKRKRKDEERDEEKDEEKEKELKDENEMSQVTEKNEHTLCVESIVDVLDQFKRFVKSKECYNYSCLEDLHLMESNLKDWLDELKDTIQFTKENVEDEELLCV